MLPRGHYLAREVGQLAGTSGNKIGQWARRGYIRASQDESVPKVYSYQDIAEAMVVHELLLRGVPHAEILAAVHNLKSEHGDAWPLLSRPIAVTLLRRTPERRSGKKAVAWLLTKDDQRYVRPAKSMDQGVLEVDTITVARDLERGGWVVRNLPDLEHVEVSPDRLSGRPTIRGRRLAAEDVAMIATEPHGYEILREDYDLADAEIEDAVRWWRLVQECEAA